MASEASYSPIQSKTKTFSFAPKNQSWGSLSFTYPQVKSNQGIINIVNNYRWKNTMNNDDEVPNVTLREYTLTYGIWAQNLFTLLKNYKGAIDQKTNIDPYGTLYFGTHTQNQDLTYVLPYIVKPGSSIRGGVRNEWSAITDPTKNTISKATFGFGDAALQKISDTVAFAGETAFSGFGQEPIYSYKGSSNRSITIEFPLYNTFSVEESLQNFEFVNLFHLQNLKTRTSFLTFKPPKLYTVDTNAMGGIYMPCAFVSSYDVKSIGTTRKLRDANFYGENGDVLIPEAYKVSITLTEALQESTNIMSGALGGSKVQVIDKQSAMTAGSSTRNKPQPQAVPPVDAAKITLGGQPIGNGPTTSGTNSLLQTGPTTNNQQSENSFLTQRIPENLKFTKEQQQALQQYNRENPTFTTSSDFFRNQGR